MKTSWDVSLHGSGYGAPELRQYYQKYMVCSLLLSIVLQLACVAPFYFFRTSDAPVDPPRIADFNTRRILITPTSIQSRNLSSAVSDLASLFHPKYAIPIPVADPFIDSNHVVLPQQQPGDNSGSYGDILASGNGVDVTVDPIDDNIEPTPFRAVEKIPEIVTRVEPKYPETAIRAGIEGSVTLNIWVDKSGKVRKAVVLRSDAQILESSAKNAAMQWIFTPAIMNHGPVSVWVSIPFRFRLHGK